MDGRLSSTGYHPLWGRCPQGPPVIHVQTQLARESRQKPVSTHAVRPKKGKGTKKTKKEKRQRLAQAQVHKCARVRAHFRARAYAQVHARQKPLSEKDRQENRHHNLLPLTAEEGRTSSLAVRPMTGKGTKKQNHTHAHARAHARARKKPTSSLVVLRPIPTEEEMTPPDQE